MLFRSASLALLASGAAYASDMTTSLNASVSVLPKCQTLSATAIAFAAYAPDGQADGTGSSTINVNCTRGTLAVISLSGGGSNNTAARKLSGTGNNTDQLAYQLYSDSNYATVWNDSSNTVQVTGEGLLTASTKTVYASIPAQQDVNPDKIGRAHV